MKRGMDVNNRENRCNISCVIWAMRSQVDGMVNCSLTEHLNALLFGEGAPKGGGRGAERCLNNYRLSAKTHRGNTSSVSPLGCHLPQRGRHRALPRQCDKRKFFKQLSYRA